MKISTVCTAQDDERNQMNMTVWPAMLTPSTKINQGLPGYWFDYDAHVHLNWSPAHKVGVALRNEGRRRQATTSAVHVSGSRLHRDALNRIGLRLESSPFRDVRRVHPVFDPPRQLIQSSVFPLSVDYTGGALVHVSVITESKADFRSPLITGRTPLFFSFFLLGMACARRSQRQKKESAKTRPVLMRWSATAYCCALRAPGSKLMFMHWSGRKAHRITASLHRTAGSPATCTGRGGRLTGNTYPSGRLAH